jgi:hypothetical protein
MRGISFALLADVDERFQSIHSRGLPPAFTGGAEQRLPMPPPCFLIIYGGDSGVFLHRYTINGECAGDTWHTDQAEAEAQATFEYGSALGEWEAFTSENEDPVAFVIRSIRSDEERD